MHDSLTDSLPYSLTGAAHDVLQTSDPVEKATKTQDYVQKWLSGVLNTCDVIEMPDRPARPEKPVLCSPSEMPKRRKAGSLKGKINLLHALAHIELNAIDLAWDIMGRFAHYAEEHEHQDFTLTKAFYDQWCAVAADEAKHFLMLESRLNDFEATYGDLPAHDGLWEAALATKDSLPARLAIVPMVLEARGLDVTPAMIAAMKKQDDLKTADLLQTIHDDEIDHVKAGTIWFKSWCQVHGLDVETYWQQLVREYFHGVLKRPFNDLSRIKAGMIPDWYEPLADEMANYG